MPAEMFSPRKILKSSATCKIGMGLQSTERKRTYRYCKFLSWPSCGTKVPDSAAFPRSLRMKKNFNWEIQNWCNSLMKYSGGKGEPTL